MHKIAVLQLLTIVTFCANAQGQCSFYGEYAEIFYQEKSKGKTPKEDALAAVLLAIQSTNDYFNLDEYEQHALELIITDISNQVYADDSIRKEDIVDKAIAYCEHMKSEIDRTQLRRINFCQNKGSNAEIVYEAAEQGISKADLLMSITGGKGAETMGLEYTMFVRMVEDIYQMRSNNSSLDSGKMGNMIYNQCLLERG